MDITGAIAGLALIAPFAPFIALAIKFESPGPAVVGLERVSKGKAFRLYKFRSMIEDAHKEKASFAHLNERDGSFFKIRNDPRVTRVGRIIRKLRIDEFPQLWNVLMGDLALVGPRPHEPREVVSYPPHYKHLILAKAGATGLSQISGASSLPFLRELELDDYYIRHATTAFDFKILIKTAGVLFSDPNAV